MVLIFLFQYFHEHSFILEACGKYLVLIKAKPLHTHTHVQEHPSPIHLPTGKIQIPVIMTRCFCLQQGIAYPASAWFSLRVEILNHLCVSGKQMSGAFHVLTGWCTNRPNEGCSGLERARALLVLPPAGPFVLYRVVSLIGARNQTAGKQVFHFLDDLFHTSWRAWLWCPCSLPVLFHLWLSEGSSGNILFTLALCDGQNLHPVNVASNLLSECLLSVFWILFFGVVVWKASIFVICTFVHFRSFHFLSRRQILALLINVTLIWRNILAFDTGEKFLGQIVSLMRCRDAWTFLCISSKNISCLN